MWRWLALLFFSLFMLGSLLALSYLAVSSVLVNPSTVDAQGIRAAAEIARTFYFVLSLVLSVVLLVLVIIITKYIWALGASANQAKFISLGVIAYFYAESIHSFLSSALGTLFAFIEDTTGTSFVPDSLPLDVDGSVRSDVLASELSRLILERLNTGLFNVRSALFPEYVTQILIGLALWLFLGIVLDKVTSDGSPDKLRMTAWYEALSVRGRHNLWLALLFGTAAYLSVASIVAIPWMSGVSPSRSGTAQSIEDRLATIRASFPSPTPSTDTDADISEWRSTAGNAVGELGTNPATPVIERQQLLARDAIEGLLEQYTSSTNGHLEALAALRTQCLQDQNDDLALAASEFQRLSQALGTERELALYASRWLEWFSDRDQQRLTDLQNAQTRWRWLVVEFRGVMDQLLTRLQEATASELSIADQELYVADLLSEIQFAEASLSLSARDNPSRIQYWTLATPALPPAGHGWGPFSWIAGWLLRTESTALALVTGMLGFGLLGSAGASFIRSQHGEEAASTHNIGLMVVRGMSAAVVVFLGVKGGLAVFAGGDSDPNAYVMFFVCLVGAVFSEDVWRWARTRAMGALRPSKAVSASEGTATKVGELQDKSSTDSDQ